MQECSGGTADTPASLAAQSSCPKNARPEFDVGDSVSGTPAFFLAGSSLPSSVLWTGPLVSGARRAIVWVGSKCSEYGTLCVCADQLRNLRRVHDQAILCPTPQA